MFQGVVIGQNAFGESGAGTIDLHVGSQTLASASSVLGVESRIDWTSDQSGRF
jgi:hypothetical protein